ncbi:hypothetical protein [Enterocloster citroniae]|uniref:Uncharacterized protein n=1 Tax=[Clostridium] citroniae WAL-17108 TaxID=742733 RepID=G5HQI0_9FIRM|nr:hypothetical protein [Enterocloster citroniae]EHE96306.1 hypothetical protein HMPREF9469_04842 [ [[Clostridium] citroniae WAL-17108]MCC3387097.1 hypothetical protein [Enterocloster citroniae]
MINKTVEALKNEQEVSTQELFELVNAYDMTSLSLSDGSKTILTMQVNRFEAYKDVFEFSQECTSDGNKYVVSQKDIVSAKGDYNEDADALSITSQLLDGSKLQMVVMHASDGFKKVDSEGFRERDVYELQEFLDSVIKEDSEWYCILTKVTDAFGFNMKMHNPARTYINTLDNWKLHISDDTNTFEVPVVDDSSNAFYERKGTTSVEYIIKPYGQPFMEIKMLFFKKHS